MVVGSVIAGGWLQWRFQPFRYPELYVFPLDFSAQYMLMCGTAAGSVALWLVLLLVETETAPGNFVIAQWIAISDCLTEVIYIICRQVLGNGDGRVYGYTRAAHFVIPFCGLLVGVALALFRGPLNHAAAKSSLWGTLVGALSAAIISSLIFLRYSLNREYALLDCLIMSGLITFISTTAVFSVACIRERRGFPVRRHKAE